MGRKVFVSYKYKDDHVAYLPGYHHHTARDYVDFLQDQKFSGDDLNKAENDNEDLSHFTNDTIRSKLRDKIWNSSITLVLISRGMRITWQKEEDQWIPWEVEYSLRTERRHGVRSLPNGMLAVILPDLYGNYDYFISRKTLHDNNGARHIVDVVNTDKTFTIIRKNMFNQRNKDIEWIQGYPVYNGMSSYIIPVRWKDFISSMDYYLDLTIYLKENKYDDYEPYIHIK